MRREFGLDERDYLFGIVGRVTPFKGQKEFLYAAARVIKQLPEARFFVIGSPAPGDLTDLEYQAELRQLVGNSGLDRHVFFLPHQSNIREFIESLDAVVMTSIGPEALPQSLIEAMFLAKPVIVSAQGGILEMMEEKVTGLLYKPGDEADLAMRMLDLVRSPELGAQLGLRARENVLEQFSRARFRQGIAEELDRCWAQ